MGNEDADQTLWEKSAPSVVAALLVAAVVGGFSAWRDVGALAERVKRLEDFSSKGDRFTAEDGRELRDEFKSLRRIVIDHNREAEGWKQRIRQCENGCGK